MDKNNNKRAIHFAFDDIDFPTIICIAQKTDNAEIVGIQASGICLEDLDIEKCNDYSLLITSDEDNASIATKKHIHDTMLLPALIMLHKMQPEELSITVLESADTDDYYWEITIMYYEDVATVCYDKTIFKKNAVQTFQRCFTN